MAKINDKTQAPVNATLDFDKLEGTYESVTRRPYIDWKMLAGRDNSNKSLVIAGFLVEAGIRLSNPKGAERKTDFHLGAIIELTHPCKAVVGGDVVEVPAGTEVMFSYGNENSDLGRHIVPLMGHDQMFWIAIRPNGELDLNNGNNPMKLFSVKVGREGQFAPVKRTGRYLLGGSTAKAPQIVAAPEGASTQARDGAKATVASLES